mmetsp:Transcript_20441/g.44552  ORF Transcript_20441/g.44552 Transcript_20441/m.44552 type:complete len:888 (+) Transcript_20441:176-2839(+)
MLLLWFTVNIITASLEVAAQEQEFTLESFPKFPKRTVSTLKDGWDFAFLGDIDIEAARHVRAEDFPRKQVSVPDAFDGREWLCGEECINNDFRQLGWPCGRCCDLARGLHGDSTCWGNTTSTTFNDCCDPVALGRRGVAVYRTQLPSSSFLLMFGACAMRCDIYFDRALLVSHVGGYSPFQVALPYLSDPEATHELLVVADNRFLPDRPVHQPYFDWYQYGGLLRPVESHSGLLVVEPGKTSCTAHQFLEHVEVRTKSLEEGLVQVILRLSAGVAECASPFSVQMGFDGAEPTLLPDPLPASSQSSGSTPKLITRESESKWELRVPQARIWSPEHPSLHTVRVDLLLNGIEVDSTVVRFGIRTVEAADGQILLNGQPLRLLGVNRHESSPRGGIFMTDDELGRDIGLLKDLGVNFVRGSHYSQDQRFLHLCDQYGLLVWEETLGWQPRLEHLQDELFAVQQMEALEETVTASCNHPSVIMWGFLNEGESNSELARPFYTMLTQLTKELDPTRLVSFASKTKFDDVTLDLADVISFNDYPGWYDSSVDEIPTVWKSYGDFVRSKYPDKPFLISEAGASGLTGFRSKQQLAKWSEDLQSAILLGTLAAVEVSGAVGIALWQFADNRVDTKLFFQNNPTTSPFHNISDADWVEHVAVEFATTNSPYSAHPLRPRRVNNKGLVSMDRQYKKQAYFSVQDTFRRSCKITCLAERPFFSWLGHPVQIVAINGLGDAVHRAGWSLAVHTWNEGDRPAGEPGLRVHAHAWETRATLFRLDSSGLLRIVSHLDQRLTAVGWHLALSGDSPSVTVQEAPISLWRAEHPSDTKSDDQSFVLRSMFGASCGSYISIRSNDNDDIRDENSVFLTATAELSKATVFRATFHPLSSGIPGPS